MRKINKFISVTKREFIKKLMYLNLSLYMKYYVKYLKDRGIKINGKPRFISNDVYFDGKDYSLIALGDNVVLSREVMLLTHDYSMHTVGKSLNLKNIDKIKEEDAKNYLLISKGISIGDNSFIGARVSILPGTHIGNNVLVGACSVVKGYIPDNSIVIGNPCKIVGKTSEWMDKKIMNDDYIIG